jgi:hypothetical protein
MEPKIPTFHYSTFPYFNYSIFPYFNQHTIVNVMPAHHFRIASDISSTKVGK